MHKPQVLAATLMVLASTTGAAESAEPLAGYDRFDVAAAHRAAPIAASVWYPAGRKTYRAKIGDNAIFAGTEAYVGAAVAEGAFPLVLLSHGSGGNMDALSWISSALARRGALVVAVNHPGSTTGDSSPRRSLQLDKRAADLSAALSQFLANPYFAPKVDRSRILSLGFSLGGATALMLAGIDLDRAAYRAYCGRRGEASQDCAFLAKGGVDLAKLPESWEQSHRDPRITAAAAVDPAFSHAYSDTSIAAMEIPTLLINLGETHRWPAADLGPKGSNLAARQPKVKYLAIAPADHFAFLAACKPGAAKLLIEFDDDPICDDPAGTDRGKVHARIVAEIAGFLGL